MVVVVEGAAAVVSVGWFVASSCEAPGSAAAVVVVSVPDPQAVKTSNEAVATAANDRSFMASP